MLDVQSLAAAVAMAGSGAALQRLARNAAAMARQRGAAATQARAAAARVTATQRRCYNTRRESAATLFLQLSSRQRCDVVAVAPVTRAQWRCYSKRRNNDAAARVIASLLQQALQQRCDAASARVVLTLKQASW